MATVNLGRIKPVFRGAYNNSTAYVIDDIVTASNETFIAIAATQGNATTDASKWTKLAAKGADGTDVGATLANKEIAFKTNAGAVDGIPIGTAGQFLKVNSGATGYEYGAVSSDCVKLASGNFPTNASELNIDNVFTSGTYNIYKVYFSNMNFAGGNNNMGVRMIRSDGNNHTQSNYAYIQTDQYRSSSANNGGGNAAGQWNESAWLFNNWNWSDNSNVSKRGAGELTLFDPMESGVQQLMTYHVVQWEQNGTYFLNFAGTAVVTTTDYTQFRGISFRSVGGHNFGGGSYAVYGFKQ